MLKFGAVLNLILAVSDGVLGFKWLFQAKENDWEPKRVFYGIIWFLNAFMQTIIACDLWKASNEEEESIDWDDFDEYED